MRYNMKKSNMKIALLLLSTISITSSFAMKIKEESSITEKSIHEDSEKKESLNRNLKPRVLTIYNFFRQRCTTPVTSGDQISQQIELLEEFLSNLISSNEFTEEELKQEFGTVLRSIEMWPVENWNEKCEAQFREFADKWVNGGDSSKYMIYSYKNKK